VYFVPALAGLGAPYWDPKAQGAFFGLTRGTTKGQTVRAALEGIAFQVSDLIGAMRQDVRTPLKVLRVDGGAAANDLLMQAQADFADVEVDRPVNLETTAFGAAMFAGLGAGIYKDLNAVKHARKRERAFKPDASPAARERVAAQLAGWQRAVTAVQVFAGTRSV
jgi:glycerol kinase